MPTAVTTVLGSLPEIRALRQEIDDALRRFDFERFDKLEEYTRALHHADVLWRGASVPKAAIAPLADELSRARDMLLINTTALATHGLIDSDRLKDCKKFPGYKPIASDVATIVESPRAPRRRRAQRAGPADDGRGGPDPAKGLRLGRERVR